MVRFTKKNISVVDNSEDEILEATKEFIMYLDEAIKKIRKLII